MIKHLLQELWARTPFGRPVRVYLAIKMTGLTGREIYAKTWRAYFSLLAQGCEVFHPALAENVMANDKVVIATRTLGSLWARDKVALRRADVLVDATYGAKSVGVEHEAGFMRYGQWKPVVRLVQQRKKDVAVIEDDGVFTDGLRAARFVAETYGSWWKRATWRWRVIVRSLPRWALDQLLAWF